MEHEILLSKLDHYEVRGLTNNWFKSYLTDHMVFLIPIAYGVSQRSAFGPLLFLLYINDLYAKSDKLLQSLLC